MPLRTLDETTLQAGRPVPVKRLPGALWRRNGRMAWILAFGGPPQTNSTGETGTAIHFDQMPSERPPRRVRIDQHPAFGTAR